MDKDYYSHKDFGYCEICTCMADSDGPTMNIHIPVVMPGLPSGSGYSNTDSSTSMKNIVSKNKGSLDISPCTTSNYITVYLPSYVLKVYQGDRFIVCFLGGDINKPYVVGRYTYGDY